MALAAALSCAPPRRGRVRWTARTAARAESITSSGPRAAMPCGSGYARARSVVVLCLVVVLHWCQALRLLSLSRVSGAQPQRASTHGHRWCRAQVQRAVAQTAPRARPGAQERVALDAPWRRPSWPHRASESLPSGIRGALRPQIELRSPTDRRLGRFASRLPRNQLDEFVFALCEASGIRTCPRPGAVNKRNRAGAQVLLREVATAARAHDRRQTLEPVAPNASHAPHRQAVEELGWLDLWLHAEESRMTHARRLSLPLPLPASWPC